MKTQQAYELVKKQEIAELKTTGLLYRHKKTGAQILSMINDDENKGIVIKLSPCPVKKEESDLETLPLE